MIGIEHYIVVSAILFVLGVLGIFLNRKNVIILLMAIELILLSVNLNLVAFSVFLHDLVGQRGQVVAGAGVALAEADVAPARPADVGHAVRGPPDVGLVGPLALRRHVV